MSQTKWMPQLEGEGPRYRILADAIAAAIKSGVLSAGEKLPPVRDLAWDLKVTPGTVSRAYQLAENRGLVEGQVGRGTFVIDQSGPQVGVSGFINEVEIGNAVDLRLNLAPDIGQDAWLTEALERVIAKKGPLPLTQMHRFGAPDAEQRAVAAQWLARGGIPERPEDLILSAGAQQGVMIALLATTGGSDALALSEPIIHPGLKDCARSIGMRLEPVEQDRDGLVPEALEAACKRYRPGALILTLNNQNPTLITTPPERRAQIAAIARAQDIQIVEDDVYGWLQEARPPSMPHFAPERSWYVGSLSKCIAAGLRAGFLLTPPGEGPRAARILQSTTQHTSWLVTALITEVLGSGLADEIRQKLRLATLRRRQVVERMLGPVARRCGAEMVLCDHTCIAWLCLPEPWRASDFVAACEARGVLIKSAEAFAVGRAPAPHAVRIGYGVVPEDPELTLGLERIADVLRAGITAIDTVA
ncbi:MAG: PLP-dependent aminotransferase family protein [Neomegalonema sp.]|nr:PLP-dependent aminotransferase family protein [Neomegalonema sp.]